MRAASLHNKKFGLLTAVSRLQDRDKYGHVLWSCDCDCGGKKTVKTSDLNAGRVQSCGCASHKSGKDSPSYKEKVRKACAYCGRIREIFPCHDRAYEKTFCSASCRGKWMSENCSGQGNGKWKPKVEVFCAMCGKTKEIHESHFKAYKSFFCDDECRGKWMSANTVGEDNNNYNGGTPIIRSIGHRISAGIRKSLKKGKDGYAWEKLLGYTRKDLFNHLGKTMPAGYTWDDISSLHIDHIVPKSSFKFSSYSDEEFKECWSIENLQLLPALENMRKGCKLNYNQLNAG